MRKRIINLWRLNEGGRKLAAGTIEAADPRELVMKWSLFLATAERGVYFAIVAPELPSRATLAPWQRRSWASLEWMSS